MSSGTTPVSGDERSAPDSRAPSPRLRLSEVSKNWAGGGGLVLDRVDLSLSAGTANRIVGSNGSGKTTLLRIASGLIQPDTGTVRLDGFDPERDRRAFQQRLGFVSTGYGGLYARLSVRAHLLYWAKLALLPADQREQNVQTVAESFALGPLLDRRVERMSMGQRQRTRLAIGFVTSPSVLLLDEPLNSLDDEGAALLVEAVRVFCHSGASVLWVSPTIDGVDIAFDQSWRLHRGELERV